MEKAQPFYVLVLDDDICLLTGLTRALKAALPDAAILGARSIAEAQVLLAEYKIKFFVLDVHLPDGTGIDFLCDIQTATPGAKVIIMTASPLPEYRGQVEALGALRFMEKPVNVKSICSLAQEHQQGLASESTQVQFPHFAAQLTSLSPMDIVQLKCLGHATQGLEFSAPHGRGRVYFYKGEIVHAETQTTTGEAALHQILSWSRGRVVELPEAKEPQRSITAHWQSVLLSAAQAIDEARAGRDTSLVPRPDHDTNNLSH